VDDDVFVLANVTSVAISRPPTLMYRLLPEKQTLSTRTPSVRRPVVVRGTSIQHPAYVRDGNCARWQQQQANNKGHIPKTTTEGILIHD